MSETPKSIFTTFCMLAVAVVRSSCECSAIHCILPFKSEINNKITINSEIKVSVKIELNMKIKNLC